MGEEWCKTVIGGFSHGNFRCDQVIPLEHFLLPLKRVAPWH